jgi:putative glutamine amidotransferase
MRPIVGISSYVERAEWGPWTAPAALVPLTYVRAVDVAGGRPLVVPPIVNAVEETLDALDGIIFSGGADLDPDVYGAPRHPDTTGLRPDRDAAEMALIEGALERAMPVLAVCRGMQLLNVARGGDLEQHLPERTGDDAHRKELGAFSRHDVEIDPDSRLGGIIGNRSLVASHHHQAPGRLGQGLVAVARAPDTTVEAIEDTDARLVLGVLWHPEEGEDGALFEALVHEAAIYRKERS